MEEAEREEEEEGEDDEEEESPNELEPEEEEMAMDARGLGWFSALLALGGRRSLLWRRADSGEIK